MSKQTLGIFLPHLHICASVHVISATSEYFCLAVVQARRVEGWSSSRATPDVRCLFKYFHGFCKTLFMLLKLLWDIDQTYAFICDPDQHSFTEGVSDLQPSSLKHSSRRSRSERGAVISGWSLHPVYWPWSPSSGRSTSSMRSSSSSSAVPGDSRLFRISWEPWRSTLVSTVSLEIHLLLYPEVSMLAQRCAEPSVMVDAVMAFRCHSCVFGAVSGSIPMTLSPTNQYLLMEHIKQKRRENPQLWMMFLNRLKTLGALE